MKSLLKGGEHRITLTEPPLDVEIAESLRYHSHVAGFTSTYPNHPGIYHEYNMALRRLESHPLVTYSSIDASKYVHEK